MLEDDGVRLSGEQVDQYGQIRKDKPDMDQEEEMIVLMRMVP